MTSWNQGIRALFQAQNGDIWVGTRWQALYRLDRNGQVKQIFSDKNYLLGAVYHIMEDKDGNLWFSTKGNGLVKAEPDMNSRTGCVLPVISMTPRIRILSVTTMCTLLIRTARGAFG